MFNPKFLIISTIFLIVFSGCTEDNTGANNQVLTVGVCTDLAPTSYIEDGEFKGFEVELIYEISKRLDLQPEFVVYSFSELLDAVSEGEVDCGIGYIGRGKT